MTLKNIVDTLIIYTKWIKIILLSLVPKKRNQNKPNNKLFFLLASQLPPDSGGGVFRPLSFLKNSIVNNWNCKAFSFDFDIKNTEAGEYLFKQIPDSITMNRIELSNLTPSWKLTPRIDGGLDNSFSMFEHIIKKEKKSPEIILASGPNFNTFLTAFYLSKYYKCPLVLDYRDEWSLCPFTWVKKEKTDHFFESMVCKQASKIIFTTQSHINNHKKRFPEIEEHKHILIPNGYDDDLIKATHLPTRNKRFTLSFIGFLGDHSLPNNFLNDLDIIFNQSSELSNEIQINFIGNKSEKAQQTLQDFNFQDNIKLVGHVSKTEALDYMKNSDALLILAGSGMKDYIPGKLFDYLAIKKPILYYGEAGEASSIINKLKAGISVAQVDHQLLSIALSSLLNNEIIIDNRLISDWLKNYTRVNLAKKLFNELNLLTNVT